MPRSIESSYDEPPAPFSRSDASSLSINVICGLVSLSSAGGCSPTAIASLSASFTGVAPSLPFSPLLFLTICRRSVYGCIGKAAGGALGLHHGVITSSYERRTKEQSDKRDGGEHNPVVHVRSRLEDFHITGRTISARQIGCTRGVPDP